jgi:hypothetical protein
MTVNIGLYKTKHVFNYEVYSGGFVGEQFMETRGNALISSVYIQSMDAGITSITVEYDQSTAGTFVEGEAQALNSHKTFTAADVGATETIVVTRIHRKPRCTMTINGTGSVKLGVYVTVTNEVASDLDSALIKDGDTFEQNTSLAMPIACYDEDNGQLFFLRCKDGALNVSVDPDAGIFREGQEDDINNSSNPNLLDSFSVPAGKDYLMSTVNVSTFIDGVFTLKAGGAIIAKGRTGPSQVNAKFQFIPVRTIATGTTITLEFDQVYETPSDTCVDWHLSLSEVDL